MKRMIAALGLLALGACEETMTSASPSGLDTGLPDPAVATCMTAVAGQTGNGIVAPSKISHTATGRTVVMGVGEARAPWECRVDGNGAVVGLRPLTNQGAA